MFHSKIMRLVAIGALAGSAAVAAVPLAGPAGAATLSIKCKKLTGNIASSVVLSGCSGNTGGKSKPIPATSLASGGTIKWVNAKTTTVKLSVKQAGTACPAGSTEYQAKGTVTADTTGSATVGGAAKALACVTASGAISLVPGTKAVI
jgi:hypothetical protein